MSITAVTPALLKVVPVVWVAWVVQVVLQGRRYGIELRCFRVQR